MKIWAAMFCLALAAPTGVLYLFDNSQASAGSVSTESAAPAPMRFEIDPSRSKFMVLASRGGLAWFKGHDHHIAVRDYGGHAELTLGALNPATLETTLPPAS